jgi:hypothetical protein
MELTLFDKEGTYVGSVDFKDREVPPEVVVFAGSAYVAEGARGVRAGGIPRFVRANTYSTNHVFTGMDHAEGTDATHVARKRSGKHRAR